MNMEYSNMSWVLWFSFSVVHWATFLNCKFISMVATVYPMAATKFMLLSGSKMAPSSARLDRKGISKKPP